MLAGGRRRGVGLLRLPSCLRVRDRLRSLDLDAEPGPGGSGGGGVGGGDGLGVGFRGRGGGRVVVLLVVVGGGGGGGVLRGFAGVGRRRVVLALGVKRVDHRRPTLRRRRVLVRGLVLLP